MRDISDSSLIVRLTSGRGWIAVLGALLAGIVFLNVLSLSLNAGSSRVSQQISELERSNSALRGELAERLSASRVEEAAAGLALYSPPGDDITYLKAGQRTGELVALINNDTVLTTDTFIPPSAESGEAAPYEGASVVTDPAAAEAEPATPTETGTTETAPTPVAPAPTTPTPAAPTSSSGGVGL